MNWRVARSLDVLLTQFNTACPGRSIASDGAIGNAAHLAEGWTNSDHNPWYPLPDGGVVTARDFTHDPAHGMDIAVVTDQLAASRDPRIKYVIANGLILDSRPGNNPWRWMPYSGPSPHREHLHLSVMNNPSCDDPRPWALPMFTSTAPREADPVIIERVLAPGYGAVRIICPVGKASAYAKTGWISAAVNGPQPGSAHVFFQNDQGGISDLTWTIPFADGHSGRAPTQVPDGTTQIVVQYTFPQGGTIAVEAG